MKICLENHIAILSAREMLKICKPLTTNLAIPFFRYTKIYPDGSRSLLCNQPDVLRFIYTDAYYSITKFDSGKPSFLYQEGNTSWIINRLTDSPIQNLMEKEINQLFNLYEGIALLIKDGDTIDVFEFCADLDFIYKIDKRILYHFVFYFKEEARKLIMAAHKEKLIVPYQNEVKDNLIKEPNEYINLPSIKRYYVSTSKDIYLTRQEVNCLQWYCRHKTTEEIAQILDCSKKTIERHVDNIKQKLNCYSKSQLIEKVNELHIF